MTPVGVGWSGEDVESPQGPLPQKKDAIQAAGDPVLWAPQPTPSPGWTQGCLLLAGRGPWLLSGAQLSLSRANQDVAGGVLPLGVLPRADQHQQLGVVFFLPPPRRVQAQVR